jgi:hypothetical protein
LIHIVGATGAYGQQDTLPCARLPQVCDTIVTTVPKSVVHCLVRKAEKNLLNHMFGHVHKLSEVEIERMLQVSISGQLRRCDCKGTSPSICFAGWVVNVLVLVHVPIGIYKAVLVTCTLAGLEAAIS